jgi:hypothetical protein
MRDVGRIAVVACLACAASGATGCGDDDSSVPFDQIPRDKKLVDLTEEERRGACEWGAAIARQKLPPPGTQLNCGGVRLTLNAPQCLPIRPGCSGTVGQWEVCLPLFVDELAQDPCLILDLGFSQSETEDFVNSIPGCEGLGSCVTTTSG